MYKGASILPLLLQLCAELGYSKLQLARKLYGSVCEGSLNRKGLDLQLRHLVKDVGNSYLCRDCDFTSSKIHELKFELVLLK